MFWKNAVRQEKTSWYLGSGEIVKRKTKMTVRRVARAIVPFRPMYLRSTVLQAMIEPGMPQQDVIR